MWRAVSLTVAALFAVFAAVQLNDPDPFAWIALYSATAVYTGVAAFRPFPWSGPAVFSAGCALLAIVHFLLWDGSSNPMGSAEQGIFAEEIVRETLGLVLAAVWMGVVAIRQFRVPAQE